MPQYRVLKQVPNSKVGFHRTKDGAVIRPGQKFYSDAEDLDKVFKGKLERVDGGGEDDDEPKRSRPKKGKKKKRGNLADKEEVGNEAKTNKAMSPRAFKALKEKAKKASKKGKKGKKKGKKSKSED